MSKLYFDIDDIRKVIADSLKAEQLGLSVGEVLGGLHDDDNSQPIPGKGLSLIRDDDSILIIANGWFKGIATAYAIGCDPNKDGGDARKHCRELDDFCEPIPMEAVEEAVRDAGATKLIVHYYTSRSLRFGVARKLGNN